MTERTRNGKTFAQDALGFVLVLVGGFFAVSIVLYLGGGEPKPGLVTGLTGPVVQLVAGLGPMAALLLSGSFAGLGTLLFLRTTAYSALRPVVAIFAASLGVALVLGAFGHGGSLGAWLPGLVSGFAGGTLTVVLGLAFAWLGWTLLPSGRTANPSAVEAIQSIMGSRHDPAGVSPAEAALLAPESQRPVTTPIPSTKPASSAPERAPKEDARAPTSQRKSQAENVVSRRAVASPLAVRESTAASPSLGVEGLGSALVAPPAPTWESDAEGLDDLEGSALDEAEPGKPQAEQQTPSFVSEESVEEEPFESPAAELSEEADFAEEPGEEAAPPVHGASWEQVGLFDEEEESVSDEVEASAPLEDANLTPSLFATDEVEPSEEQEAPLSAELDEEDEEEDEEDEEEDEEDEEDEEEDEEDEEDEEEASLEPVPSPKSDFVLTPVAPPEPVVTPEGEEERWGQLVFDAGCAILEQKRVAVSMLERRFGLDFDEACRVLDELQEAGLIGPYMGGRTRDILLTREEWLARASHAPRTL